MGACTGDGGGTSVTPPSASPPSPPPTVAASFAASSLEVSEGDTVEVVIRYTARELPGAWSLHVSALPGTAAEEDFELAVGAVEIPAGTGASGEVAVSLTAANDLLFAEGDETLILRFVRDPAVGADLGDDLEVVIREAGVSPCAGLRVEALPPAEAGEGRPPGLSTRMTIERSGPATETRMHFAGPYFLLSWWDNDVARGQPMSAVGIADWRFEKRADSTVHELEIEWPEEHVFRDFSELTLLGDSDLRLRFAGGPCDGESVTTCSAAGCELIP